MQNRSTFPVRLDEKNLPADFPAHCQSYTQVYQREHALHYHNCLEIGLCVEGGGVQFLGGELYPFSAQTISIVRKNCVHDAHIVMQDPGERPSRWKFIFVDPEALGVPETAGRSFLSADRALVSLFELLFRELDARPEGYQAQFRLLLQAFFAEARRAEPSTRPLRSTPASDQIASLLHFIAHEYANDLTIEELARRCQMSPGYFRRVFRTCVGMGPQQYILHVRLLMAEHLLRTTARPVLEISEEVGFGSVSSLNRQFLRAYGLSPRAFRRAQGKM